MDSVYLDESERKGIKTIFDKYDKNKNGLLEKEELFDSFHELLKLIDEYKNDEEIKVIVRKELRFLISIIAEHLNMTNLQN